MSKIKVAVLLPFDQAQREVLEAAGKERCEFIYVEESMTREARLPLLKEAEVIFGEPGIREIRECPGLRWIQMSWAGSDVYTMREGFPKQIRLTNARGCFRTVIAEYILAVLLSMCRNLKQYADQQREEDWRRIRRETLLYGKKVLILGAGDIGTGAAKRLKAFGTSVTGMRRTDRNYPDCYDAMITVGELDQVLPAADIVIGCLPSTRETRGLLDERRLRSMKKDAFLINVGRGSLIPTEDLVKVLEDGHLGGVALDVTEKEPLPAGHPLWKFDRVILTPHIAGQSFGYSRDTENRVLHVCCQNLERYLNRRELLNQVDFEAGYVSE
ncbi:MAG: D-2-hydroxyacid dehydrogenase [Lachnospiraceae bacterium]|nr:D-2-hydroxyacid dehydrogenase [Lachnospiraceae bacterium]